MKIRDALVEELETLHFVALINLLERFRFCMTPCDLGVVLEMSGILLQFGRDVQLFAFQNGN